MSLVRAHCLLPRRRVLLQPLLQSPHTAKIMVSARRGHTSSHIEAQDGSQKRKKLRRDRSEEPETQPEAEQTETKRKRKKSSHPNLCDKESLPSRAESLWKVGAHVSSAGGVENAIANAAAIGANAFALFVKSQRKWESPPLTKDSISSFKARMAEYNYSPRVVLPHGSYLINLANPNQAIREKSYRAFLDDLRRCEELGLELYNFHPGSTVGATTPDNSMSLIAEHINRAHAETNNIIIVLENMAGAGHVIGGDFSHLATIISQVKDKTRVGVCLDTCHMFAAGYDIRTKEGWNATMEIFQSQVGLKYLRGMHLNDSKAPHNSKKDRHENIGLGHLGLQTFHHILNDPRVQNIPLILETPSFEQPREVWAKEITVLNSLSRLNLTGETSELDSLTTELRQAVKNAEKVGGKSSSKKKQPRKGRRKNKEEDDSVSENENDDDEEHVH